MAQFTPRQIINRAEQLGFLLSVREGKLCTRAGQGVSIPEKARQVIAQHEAAIIRELAATNAPNSAPTNAPVIPSVLASEQDEAAILRAVQAYMAQNPPLCGPCLDADTETIADGDPVEDSYFCICHKPQVKVVAGQAIPSFLYRYAEALLPGSRVALDCETTGLDRYLHKIVSVQFGLAGSAHILDVRTFYDLSPEQRREWCAAFQRLFDAPVTWLGHNLKFDWLFLVEHFNVKPGATYDTMIAEQCLHNGHSVKYSMEATAQRYGLEANKQEQMTTVDLDKSSSWHTPFSAELLAYMAQDVEMPHQFYAAQQPLLEQQDLQRVVQLENEAMRALVAMEARGALIDREQLAQIAARKREKQATLELQLLPILKPAYEKAMQRLQDAQRATHTRYEAALKEQTKQWMREYPSIASTMRWQQFYDQQLAEFQKTHGQPLKVAAVATFKLSSGEQLVIALAAIGVEVDDTQEATLQEVAGQHMIMPALIEWRKLQTSLNTFCSKLPTHIRQDGRIHADFHTVASGRYVTSTPNLQALPKQREEEAPEDDPRRCVVAAPGHVLLESDLSNIELRILAEVAHDETMLRFFAEGKDLHAETAKLMFNLPADTDTKKHLVHGKSARAIAKTINFGLAYGMGAQGLANRTGVDLDTAKGLMQRYFATYRGVNAYLRKSGKEALKRGYAVSLSGRRRFFPTMEGMSNSVLYGRFERSAKNHPIQATNADILKRALALLYKRLPESVYTVLTIHDEIILECPDGMIEEATRVLQSCMLEACHDFLKVVAVPTPEVLTARYWRKD
jgi:DNA polymerase-1